MCSRATPRTRCLPRRCAHGTFLYRSPRIICPAFVPRQQASAFNQPLSFDTSSVTTMQQMFYQTSAFNQPLSFDTSSVTTMHLMFYRAWAFNQPLSFDTSKVTTMHSMFLRASPFNQPLSFDTSSVRSMYGMFNVRCSPCPAPNLQSGPRLCALAPPLPATLPPPSDLQLAPHTARMPSVRLSAGRVGVQPAAELRHIRRHNHEKHVPSALLPVSSPCPVPPICNRALRQRAACTRPPSPATFPPPDMTDPQLA
eukprot:scaffold26979_cov53-Phaeocystis_antarctica.AAC.1